MVLLDSQEVSFPDPEFYHPKDGLLAIGGDLSVERLLLAYQNGIFPWSNPGAPQEPWTPETPTKNRNGLIVGVVIAMVVAIATAGAEGPHVAATWADFVIVKQADGKDLILIPAGGYKTTEENLKNDPRSQLLIGSKQLSGKSGSGSGYRLSGLGAIETTGANFEAVHTRFSWARAALVIEVQSVDQLL